MKNFEFLTSDDNSYITNIKNIISQYKNDFILKAFNFYLNENYNDAEMVLLSEYPEDCFNKDIIVQYLMGHIKLKLKEFEPSLTYFLQALSIKDVDTSLFPLIYDSRGLAYLIQQKDYNAAILNFKDACNHSQNNFHFHNHLAFCYKIIYSLEKETNKKILNNSDFKSNYSKIGDNKLSLSKSVNDSSEIESSNNEKESKRNKFNKKLSKFSDNTTGSKTRIKYKDSFQEALNLNPNCYLSLLNLGTFYIEEEEIDQAEKYFKKAELINKQITGKKDWKIYLNLAFLAFKEKEYPLSLGYFEILFKSYENKVDLKALNVYMVCLYLNKEWKKLEKTSKKILKMDKKNKKALVYLITSLEKNKKNSDLFLILKKVKSKMKKIKQEYIIESSSENKSKSQKELAEQFQSPIYKYNKLKQIIKKMLKKVNEDIRIEQQDTSKVQNVDPNFQDLNNDNLRSFGFKHDYIEKIMVLQNKNKNSLEALFNLGYIYYKEEEFIKSEQYFQKIMELNQKYKKNIINEYMGDIYMNLYKLPRKALVYYNKAHSVNFNISINENNNLSTSNFNSNYGSELLLVKIGICYEVLDDTESALKYYNLAYKKNEDFVNPIFRIGCIYDKKNNLEEALKWLEIAYEKEKENVDYLQKYGECLVKSKDENNISKGILILEQGFEFFTGDIDIISSLAKGYEKKGRLKEAISLLEKAKNIGEFYNNPSKIFQLAFYYEKNKELTKAIENFKKVLYLDKKNIEALIHIGFIYHSIKENVKAFKCFKEVLNLEKDNFLAYYGLGRLYHSLENHNTEAINCYKKCLEIDPDSIKAHLQLGILYLKIKKFDESLKCLEDLIILDPNNILGLTALGNVYLELKDYSKAKEYLESALNLDKKNVEANAALGDVLFCMDEINEAMQKYIFVNKFNDNIPQVHLNLAHCFFIKEKYESAINHYITAIRLVKNTRHDYYYFLGNALVACFRFKDGIVAYQAAIKLKPNQLNYYYAIAKACFIEKLNHKGIKYLEKLLRLEKNKKASKDLDQNEKDYKYNDALFLLYKLYINLPEPNINKCLIIIKSLIRNEPKNVKYLGILAVLQEKKNNLLEAIKAYKQILLIEPNNTEAKKKLNLLDTNESKKNLLQSKSSSRDTKKKKSSSNNKNSENSKSNASSSKSDSESSDDNKSSNLSSTNKEKSNTLSKALSKRSKKTKKSRKSKSRKSKSRKSDSKSRSRNKKSESRIKSFNSSNLSKQSDFNGTSDNLNKKISESSEKEKNEIK